jgi:hypothetical protein
MNSDRPEATTSTLSTPSTTLPPCASPTLSTSALLRTHLTPFHGESGDAILYEHENETPQNLEAAGRRSWTGRRIRQSSDFTLGLKILNDGSTCRDYLGELPPRSFPSKIEIIFLTDFDDLCPISERKNFLILGQIIYRTTRYVVSNAGITHLIRL